MKTTNVRKQIAYEGFNQERWIMSIGFDNTIMVISNGEKREYLIIEPIIKIVHETEYVFIYVEDDKFYQFKFEVDNFLVADIFTNDGEHLDSFASHVFGENIIK